MSRYPSPHDLMKSDPNRIVRYASKKNFEAAGGATKGGMGDRYVVSVLASYCDGDVENATDAVDSFLRLFTEDGGWVVMVWDTVANEGWSYHYVGPGWTDYLPGFGGSTAQGNDPALLAKVNRYRRWQGKPAFADGEWSDADLRELLDHAPSSFRNPSRRTVAGKRKPTKRSLMR